MFAPLGLFFHVVFLYVCPSVFVTMFLFICVCSSFFLFFSLFFFCGYFLCACCSLLFPLLLLFYAGLILCKFGGDDLQQYKRETERERERGGGGQFVICIKKQYFLTMKLDDSRQQD